MFCKSSQHLETKFSLSDSDEEASGFSSGSLGNCMPGKVEVSDSSDYIPEVRE
jgi:hypothetical protein